MSRLRHTVATLLWICALPLQASEYVLVPGGEFHSAIHYEDAAEQPRVAPFMLMRDLVSQADFARFVHLHPQWSRGQLPAVFASSSYLRDWATAQSPAADDPASTPVVNVNWYAANAYCRADGARLPTFLEWEYVAAADASRRDARGDARWLGRLLADGTARAIDAQTGAVANAYGIRNLHGAAWEWSEDFSSLLGAGDRRGQNDGDTPRFCGATALAFDDRQQYGVQKRFALLSALNAADTLGYLGFRCARSSP